LKTKCPRCQEDYDHIPAAKPGGRPKIVQVKAKPVDVIVPGKLDFEPATITKGFLLHEHEEPKPEKKAEEAKPKKPRGKRKGLPDAGRPDEVGDLPPGQTHAVNG
jgi:hypothetical protein